MFVCSFFLSCCFCDCFLAANVLNQLTHSPGIQAANRCMCLSTRTGLGQGQCPRAQPCGLRRVCICYPGQLGSRCSANSTRTFSRGRDVYNRSWKRFPSVTLDQLINKLKIINGVEEGEAQTHARPYTKAASAPPACSDGSFHRQAVAASRTGQRDNATGNPRATDSSRLLVLGT